MYHTVSVTHEILIFCLGLCNIIQTVVKKNFLKMSINVYFVGGHRFAKGRTSQDRSKSKRHLQQQTRSHKWKRTRQRTPNEVILII
jgi:hypothetical protein